MRSPGILDARRYGECGGRTADRVRERSRRRTIQDCEETLDVRGTVVEMNRYADASLASPDEYAVFGKAMNERLRLGLPKTDVPSPLGWLGRSKDVIATVA